MSAIQRDLRLLLLFCEGARPVISGTELTTKFGCGDPFVAARDLPSVHEFCERQHCPFPIVPSEGTTAKPTYELVWSRALARRLWLLTQQSPETNASHGPPPASVGAAPPPATNAP